MDRPSPSLNEAAFGEAAMAALKHFLRADRLAGNPLLGARIVESRITPQAGQHERIAALCEVLTEECEAIGHSPKLRRQCEVLRRTYLQPHRSRDDIASDLNLSFSTYCRALKEGRELLVARLWEREQEPLPSDKGTVELPTAPRSHKLRIAVAVFILLVAVAALVVWQLVPAGRNAANLAAAVRTGKTTLAVLPFVDESPDGKKKYLSDGITDLLINRLGRVPGLRTVARTSSFALRGERKDVREAGKILGVDNILEGSVHSQAGKLRVSVALVNTRDGYERWSHEYEFASGDLPALEDSMTRDVVQALDVAPSGSADAVVSESSAANNRARNTYLVGLEYLHRHDIKNVNLAIAHFLRAINFDPHYATAWAGLATAYTVLIENDSDSPPDRYYSSALAAANKAIQLDPGMGQPHAILAQLHTQHWEWGQAETEYQRALKLDPSNATAHQWYGMYLWVTGDLPAALKQMRMAHTLDPLSPSITVALGETLQDMGKLDEAFAWYRSASKQAPHFALPHLFLAYASLARNDSASALKEMKTAVSLTPEPHPAGYLALLGVYYSYAGDHAKTEQLLAELHARARQHYVSSVAFARLYQVLGEKDKMLDSLARAAREYDFHMLWVVVDTDGPSWKKQPRFRQILASMNLPMQRAPQPDTR
ncbi:MAG: tetratricopeptide repeat protein [Gammaproteobacteria bacterium]